MAVGEIKMVALEGGTVVAMEVGEAVAVVMEATCIWANTAPQNGKNCRKESKAKKLKAEPRQWKEVLMALIQLT
jgi:hypothetical protein